MSRGLLGLVLFLGLTALGSLAVAQSTWQEDDPANRPDGGEWRDNLRWDTPSFPDADGATAIFPGTFAGGAAGHFVRNISITGGNVTVGTLTLDHNGGNGNRRYHINGPSSLVFQNGGGTAILNSSRQHRITTDVVLTDSLQINHASSTLLMSGDISGPGGITFNGAASNVQLTINGNNSYGGLFTINNGKVEFNNTLSSMAGPGGLFSDVRVLGTGRVARQNSNNAGQLIDQAFINRITTDSTGTVEIRGRNNGINTNNLDLTNHPDLFLAGRGASLATPRRFEGTLNISGNPFYRFGGANTGFLELVNPLNEAGAGLIVDKGGTIISNNANTFGGTVTISGGTYVTDNIANAGVASGLGQGAGAITVNGGSFQFGGTNGSTDREFNLSAGGSIGAANLTSLLDLTGTVTGDVIKQGPGTLVLSGNIAGVTSMEIQNGALRGTETFIKNLPGVVQFFSGSAAVIEVDNSDGLNGAVSFVTGLDGAPGIDIDWNRTSNRNGGFAAFGNDVTLQLVDSATNLPYTVLDWTGNSDNNGFLHNSGQLILGSGSANAKIELSQDIDFSSGGGDRTVRVVDNPNSDQDVAVLSGNINSGGPGRDLIKTDRGTLALTGNNNIDQLRINGGAVRLTEAQIGINSTNLPIQFDNQNHNDNSVIEIDNTAGATDTFVHSGAGGQVEWRGGIGNANNRRSGGFAAFGNDVNLTLTDGTTATTVARNLAWDGPGFIQNLGELILSSNTADSRINLRNNINLNGAVQDVHVVNNIFSGGDIAELSGQLTNGTLQKIGPGTLDITNATNSLTRIDINAGAVRADSSVIANENFRFNAGNRSNFNVLEIDNSDNNADTISLRSADGGQTIHFDTSGGFAAFGNDVALTIVDAAGVEPAALDWGNTANNNTEFLHRGAQFVLGSVTADAIIDLTNNVTIANFNGNNNERQVHEIAVIDNPHSSTDGARLSGAWTNFSGIQIDGGGNLDVAGTLAINSGDFQLDINGPGTTLLASSNIDVGTLAGNNSANDIRVNSGGTLLVQSPATVFAAGDIIVGNGSTLGGDGTLATDSVQMQSGSTVSPGSSVGILTHSTADASDVWAQQAGSIYNWEVGAGNAADLVKLLGPGTLDLETGWVLNILNDGAGNISPSDTFDLFMTEGSITVDNQAATDALVDGSFVLGVVDSHFDTNGVMLEIVPNVTGGGSTIVLTGLQAGGATVIPEPTTIAIWSLLGLAVSGYVARRVRKK